MPSSKKTSPETPASSGARGKAGDGNSAPIVGPSKFSGSAPAESGRGPVGSAGSAGRSVAKSAAKKTAASKALAVKSPEVAVLPHELDRPDPAGARKPSKTKSDVRAKRGSVQNDSVKTGKVGAAKATPPGSSQAVVEQSAIEAAAPAAVSKQPTAAAIAVEGQEASTRAGQAASDTSDKEQEKKPTAPSIAAATKALSAAAAAKRPATSEAMANKPLEKTLSKMTTGAKVSAPTSPTSQAIQPESKAAVSQSATKAVAGAKPKAANKHGFKLNEFIVYPAHGVGQITAIEVQEVAGFSLELFVVSFIKDKMILKVPTSKVASVGMRKLADADVVEKALATLTGRARVKRTMWSRRAQEYEAKINSGDLVTISEVVRDLYRSDSQPEQSYSERQLYEAALDRMAREISVVRKLIDSEALKLIESHLQKGPRRGQKSEIEADAAEEGDDSDVEEAA